MQPGTQLGHYEILSAIGKGGMGEVWRARDTTLGREVAIKTLPPEFARDPDRLARFEREAKLLASLNHPNIAAIYGLEEHAGTRFLVLELVLGDTLADRLRHGPVPEDEVLKLAGQIADALEAAHEKGVIHRDLKPANIKVDDQGRVKVLDFGLAKALVGNETPEDFSQSPTLTAVATQQGVILGTAPYMSPEQVRGRSLDRRSDVWSFGVVLYEMLTGKALFTGESVSDVLAGVLRQDPDFTAVPPRFRSLVGACLTRDLDRRLRHVGDIRLLVHEPQAETAAQVSASGRTAWLWPAIAGLGLVAVTIWIVGLGGGPGGDPRTAAYTVVPEGPDVEHSDVFGLSPDGRYLAFNGTSEAGVHVWIYDFASGTQRPLEETFAQESSQLNGPPMWSPDGAFIAFWRDGALLAVDVGDGSVRRIAQVESDVTSGFWSEDGVIVFGTSDYQGLYRVPAGGGTPVLLTEGGQPQYPSPLPDGRFLYTEDLWNNIPGLSGRRILVGSMEQEPGDPPLAELFPGDDDVVTARYLPSPDRGRDGSLVYLRLSGTTLWAESFDPRTLTLGGDPRALASGASLEIQPVRFGVFLRTGFSASTQRIVYWAANIQRFAVFDRNGREIGAIGEPGSHGGQVVLSPDGSRLAVIREEAKGTTQWDIWSLDVTGQRPGQVLVDSPGGDLSPTWSPDATRLAYTSQGGIWVMASNRTGEPQRMPDTGLGVASPRSWCGEYLLLDSGGDIWVWSFSDENAWPLTATERTVENFPRFSRDCRWIAYRSDQSGQTEIHVTAFDPDAQNDRPAEQVSLAGGDMAGWAETGELFFTEPGDPTRLMAVEIVGDTNGNPIPGEPRYLFDAPLAYAFFDVFPDGNRFVIPVDASPDDFHVIDGWPALLNQD